MYQLKTLSEFLLTRLFFFDFFSLLRVFSDSECSLLNRECVVRCWKYLTYQMWMFWVEKRIIKVKGTTGYVYSREEFWEVSLLQKILNNIEDYHLTVWSDFRLISVTKEFISNNRLIKVECNFKLLALLFLILELQYFVSMTI